MHWMRCYWSLPLFTTLTMVVLGNAQEKNRTTHIADEKWPMTSRNIQKLLHEQTRGVANTEGYIRRYSGSWRVYAKANSINKREKLKKALEQALNSIKVRSVASPKLNHDSVDKIRGAAKLLKDFKTMYRLSHSVLDTWKRYQVAKENLMNISKTDQGRDVLNRYLSLREEVMNKFVNKTKRYSIPTPFPSTHHNASHQRSSKRSIQMTNNLLDGTSEYEIKLFRGIPGLRTIKKRKKERKHEELARLKKNYYGKTKRNGISHPSPIVDDSIPGEEYQPSTHDDEVSRIAAMAQEYTRKNMELLLGEPIPSATAAFQKAKDILRAEISHKNAQDADKKSLVAHSRKKDVNTVANDTKHDQSLGKVIIEVGSSKILPTPRNSTSHVISVMASLVDEDEKGTLTNERRGVASSNQTVDGNKLETNNPVVSGATLILKLQGRNASKTAKHHSMGKSNSAKNEMLSYIKEENVHMKHSNHINPLIHPSALSHIVKDESQQKHDKNLSLGIKGNKQTFQLTEQQKRDAQKVPILKLSDMRLLQGSHQNEMATNSSTVDTGVDRPLETFKRLQEAKQARKRFVLAKQEFARKVRELYTITKSLENKLGDHRGYEIQGGEVSDEVPRDQVSAGDNHPGIGLSGVYSKGISFSSQQENGDDHRGFTLGMLDTLAGSNQQHEIKLPDDGVREVGKAYEVDLPKEFSFDDVQPASVASVPIKPATEGKKDDEEDMLKALTKAIKDDLTEIQENEKHDKPKLEPSNQNLAIGTVIKQFAKTESPEGSHIPTTEKQGLKQNNKQEEAAGPSVEQTLVKTDDAFKEVEDYLSKALDDIAKQTDDVTKVQKNEKSVKEKEQSKAEPTKMQHKEETKEEEKAKSVEVTKETDKEKKPAEEKHAQTDVQSEVKPEQKQEAEKVKNIQGAKPEVKPNVLVPQKIDNEAKVTPDIKVDQNQKVEQDVKAQEKPKLVTDEKDNERSKALEEIKLAEKPKDADKQKEPEKPKEADKPKEEGKPKEENKPKEADKLTEAAKSKPIVTESDKSQEDMLKELEDETKRKLLEKVMAKMEEQASDPSNIHPLVLPSKNESKSSDTQSAAPKEGNDDHIAKPNPKAQDQKETSTSNKQEDANNQKTLEKAQKLEDEVAHQQDKMYNKLKEDDPYKTINEGTKPLFAGNEIDPVEKKEAEERLKATELEREESTPEESKPQRRHHSRHHHHQRRHHHYHEEPKEEDDDEEDDETRDGGRDEIRDDFRGDANYESNEEPYEDYDDDDDDDDERDDDREDDDDADDEDDKKSRVQHDLRYESQLPYSANVNGREIVNGDTRLIRNNVPTVPLLESRHTHSTSIDDTSLPLFRRHYHPFHPGLNVMQKNSYIPLQLQQQHLLNVHSPSLIPSTESAPLQGDRGLNDVDSPSTESNSLREELEDSKRSFVPNQWTIKKNAIRNARKAVVTNKR